VSDGSVVALAPGLPRQAVLRCLDYPPGREPPPRTVALLDEVERAARGLLDARGVWRSLPVSRCGELGLEPVDARGLVVGLVTIGPALEARVAELQAAGGITRALLLDACGSAAAEAAADLLSALALGSLGLVAPSVGVQGGPGTPSCRLSPGYGRWGLDSQPAVLGLVGADALGINLTPGMLMVPRKSISFAMWLGARERPAEGLSGCRACGLRSCRYLHS
jgi:hypothetical protein